MSDGLVIRIDSSKLRHALLVSAPEAIASALRTALARFGRQYVNRMTKERLSGPPGLNRVTGNLARTLSTVVVGTEFENMQLAIIFGAKYATVHEFGGEVRRKAATVRAHTRTWRGQTIAVRTHVRGAHIATFEPRLEARRTFVMMAAELQRGVNEAAQKALEKV